jgi:hypothetical protein
MSAFMVDKTHVDLMVKTALVGPSGRAVNPGNAWSRPRWTDVDRPALDAMLWSEAHEHFRTVAWLGQERPQDISPDQLGAMLVAENLASIHYRYPDTIGSDELPGPLHPYWLDYTYTDPGIRMTTPEALKAINCYEYQSCEHDGWHYSEAYRFCRALTDALVGHVEGYSDAPWDWTAVDVAKRRNTGLPHTIRVV